MGTPPQGPPPSGPSSGGAPGGGPGGPAPGGGSPSQMQAPPELIMLARIHQVLAQLAQAKPILSQGLQKAMDGINEAQSAMVSQSPSGPANANPPQ